MLLGGPPAGMGNPGLQPAGHARTQPVPSVAAGGAPAAPPAAGAPAARSRLPQAPVPVPGAAARSRLQPVPPGVPFPAWRELTALVAAQREAGHPLPPPDAAPACGAAGCTQRFGETLALWSPGTGAHLVRAAVYSVWSTPQGASLGFPVRSEYPQDGAYRTDFQHGSLMYAPDTGRVMNVVPGVEDSALLIGDSQAGGDTWLGQGLAQAGYPAIIRGAAGTGYVQGNATIRGYARALETGQWLLPWGTPSLVILQGGGNDSGRPAAEIRAGAVQLIRDVRQSYPSARIIMVGVIGDGTGPRMEADRVLAETARQEGLPFLDPGDWWVRYNLNGALRPDGRHLSAEGHSRTAPVFARELAMLAPPRPRVHSPRPPEPAQ